MQGSDNHDSNKNQNIHSQAVNKPTTAMRPEDNGNSSTNINNNPTSLSDILKMANSKPAATEQTTTNPTTTIPATTSTPKRTSIDDSWVKVEMDDLKEGGNTLAAKEEGKPIVTGMFGFSANNKPSNGNNDKNVNHQNTNQSGEINKKTSFISSSSSLSSNIPKPTTNSFTFNHEISKGNLVNPTQKLDESTPAGIPKSTNYNKESPFKPVTNAANPPTDTIKAISKSEENKLSYESSLSKPTNFGLENVTAKNHSINPISSTYSTTNTPSTFATFNATPSKQSFSTTNAIQKEKESPKSSMNSESKPFITSTIKSNLNHTKIDTDQAHKDSFKSATVKSTENTAGEKKIKEQQESINLAKTPSSFPSIPLTTPAKKEASTTATNAEIPKKETQQKKFPPLSTPSHLETLPKHQQDLANKHSTPTSSSIKSSPPSSSIKKNGNDKTPSLRTSSRLRKSVERMSSQSTTASPQRTTKAIETMAGTGVALGEISHVSKQLTTKKASYKPIIMLHRLAYGRPGEAHKRKSNLRKFNGLAASEDLDKLKEKLLSHTVAEVNNLAMLLNVEKSGDKASVVERLVSFLASPKDLGESKKFAQRTTLSKRKQSASKQQSKEKKSKPVVENADSASEKSEEIDES